MPLTIYGCVIQHIPSSLPNSMFLQSSGPASTQMLGKSAVSHSIWAGWGLRSASRTIHAACWGSWADCLSTIRQRHANIAQTMVEALDSPPVTAIHLVGAASSRAMLAAGGFVSPFWYQLLQGWRPQQPAFDEIEPNESMHGWQFFVDKVVEERFRSTVVWPRCTTTQQALLRSQSGPMSGLPFSAVPSPSSSRFPAHLFRVLLFRCFWLPLPLTSRTCRCGRLLDVHGHHRAACARAGVLGGRGFSVESAAARVCREAGARVSTNVFVRDLDLPVVGQDLDGRRLEVVADGLPLSIGDRHHARVLHSRAWDASSTVF